MLPGFRFLFAATFLTMSILVFGLGAAALLRAAHEQFATNPAWHSAPEATFAQQVEAPRPVLRCCGSGGRLPNRKHRAMLPSPRYRHRPSPRRLPPRSRSRTAQPDAAKSDLPAAEAAVAAAPGNSPVSNETKPATPTLRSAKPRSRQRTRPLRSQPRRRRTNPSRLPPPMRRRLRQPPRRLPLKSTSSERKSPRWTLHPSSSRRSRFRRSSAPGPTQG